MARSRETNQAALILRIGLGLVFTIGGWSKLSQLLSATAHDGLVASYTGSAGYINSFFMEFLFGGAGGSLTPSFFLTALSTFELISGLFLLAGVLVRPLALIYAFLLWAFVIALPVVTAPGVDPSVAAFRSPEILVQIRDIGLSGLMFILFNVGAGSYALDHRLGFEAVDRSVPHWNYLGLVLRLSLGAIFVVGGVFAGMDHIPTFATNNWLLLAIGVVLLAGHGARYAGYAVGLVMLYYIGTKVNFDASLISNLNGIKRELALLSASIVLGLKGGGELYTLRSAGQWLTSLGTGKASAQE